MPDPEASGAPDRPGPVYDRAMRRLVEADVAGFCELLGVRLESAGSGERLLAGTFPGVTRTVDLLVRTGPDRLLHVEYQLRAERGLALRMLGYRAAIMAAHPLLSLDQRVVVLGDGSLDSVDHAGFRLGCEAVYLRDLDPAGLLDRPVLAPLAVPAGGTPSSGSRRSAPRFA